ncbi:peptidoglycan-binding protein [Aetokthonos hydrillicola Thurmond2011]|jgi:peptidoglycan hydrolase-like protein with peptidoglycan-binding domain|uniref:Peptidoglycan-binding protein n=1 Tax=Aetokthonos hydrillicola Thurmond2011 TaxID=2712845 RepID=A0AAP5I2Q0_9CYAN|nr:peptidoglycan-binding protein [Aetokthonos hydrillicola]MBO3462282.1 peptidoglycan-binding protein [Aetokthonos hydrillicola CCALA 1050]MBW4589475.1 peptidoglycan-binding protein [Aetokthonos hydrillicola CCALA 1050]MDR9893681.1 peptidoglycan-binding protein [Aetokthonos hydrillicola Thurmond2011]
MKESAKTSILKYLQGQKEQKAGVKILLSCCIVMFFNLVSVVSFAATPQIAQVNTATNINRPTLKLGSQGDSVSEVQAALKLLGFYTGAVDGIYNSTTASAVSKFKQAAGLNPDGIVDGNTWQQLFPSESTATPASPPHTGNKVPNHPETSNTSKVAPTPEPKPSTKPNNTTSKVVNSSNPEPKPATPNTGSQKPPARHNTTTARAESDPTIQYTQSGFPILRLKMRGPEVVKLQKRLQKLGFFEGSISGYFGTETESAVKAAQQRYSLEADGVVGGETWEALMRRR